jgi:hypothetical protein
MDHATAVAVILNAMQSDQTPEDIRKEISTLLQTVNAEDRDAVLTEAAEQYKRLGEGPRL